MRALVNDYQASVNTAVCETFCQTWCSAIDFAEVYFKRVYQGNLTRATDQHAAQCQAHCLDCALNQAIQHEHTLCEDCAIAWAPIACVAFVAKNDAVTADMRKRAEHIQEDFTLYVGHLVRERWSKQVREDIMWSLGLDEVMITIDWAMKWLPMRQLETQREWFGQRGLSWHCASVIRSTDGGKTFEISYIDFVMREDGQTWADVLQALQHILSLVKMEFPAITKVKLFADNAGCYSSNMIYANLRTLGDPIGIKICAFYHSESQAGKTEVDSHLGNKKREVRADVCTADADAPQAPTSRKDAATPTELYARLSSLCHRGEYAGLVSPRDHPAAGQPGGPAVKAETEKLASPTCPRSACCSSTSTASTRTRRRALACARGTRSTRGASSSRVGTRKRGAGTRTATTCRCQHTQRLSTARTTPTHLPDAPSLRSCRRLVR